MTSDPGSNPYASPDEPRAGAQGPPGPGWWRASDGQYYPPQGQAAPPAPYGYGGYGMQQQKTNGLAIASLVLGIIWIYWVGSILALVFGYIARSQIKKSGGTQTGGGLAVAGIVLGWIGVAAGLAVAALLIVVAANGGFENDYDGGINSDPANGVCDSSRYYQDPDC